MKVKFINKLPTAKNIYTFQFDPGTKIDYTAGQYIRMNLEHGQPDDRSTSRFFTLSSAPTQPYLTITTKFSEPSSSFKQALFNLPAGQLVTMSRPEGDFVLPKDEAQPLTFVAGGIGVTPYHSIIQWLADSGQTRPIHLLYAVNNAAEIVFKDLFDGLSWLKVEYLVGQKLDGQTIQKLAGGWGDKLIYLSGPEPMVESLETQLQDLGLPKKQIRTDFFPGYKAF